VTYLISWEAASISPHWTSLLVTGRCKWPLHHEIRQHLQTHKGLHEFNVMPIGLRNAPAVFQRLMQHILMSIYPQTGPTFVSAYLDDIIFSQSFTDHLNHIRQVIQCIADTGLNFKLSKGHFIRQEVEYLVHPITPSGILPNPAHVSALQQFPVSFSVKEI